jgi:hypothetical protein
MQLRVVAMRSTDHDLSMNPADYVNGKKTMIPLAINRNAAGDDNVSALEIWKLNGAGGWSHPVHIHFEEGIVLNRDGKPPPAWETWARKDVYRIGPESDSRTNITLAIRFREFAGSFMEHCHNTQHEDHAMLLRWDIEHPGQTQLMPAPIPTWDGVQYVDSAALPTFRTGDGVGKVLRRRHYRGVAAAVAVTALVVGVTVPLRRTQCLYCKVQALLCRRAAR